MSRDDASTERLLRWYPVAWRERYGEEFTALMSDDLGDRRPSAWYRTKVALSGLRERGRRAGVTGQGASRAERTRAGSLVVLSAWSLTVVGGASFAKMSEHFTAVVPRAQRGVPTGAYVAVVVFALLGLLVVAAGAAIALPALRRFLRAGGWMALRRCVVRAVVATALVVTATAALAVWAHHLTSPQRNGGNALYGAVFLAWGAILVATLGLWTAAVVRAARRISLSDAVLRAETVLAATLTLLMAGVASAYAIWWVSMARVAPWFLAGSTPGAWSSASAGGSTVTFKLVATMVVLVVPFVVATYGTLRALTAREPASTSAV